MTAEEQKVMDQGTCLIRMHEAQTEVERAKGDMALLEMNSLRIKLAEAVATNDLYVNRIQELMRKCDGLQVVIDSLTASQDVFDDVVFKQVNDLQGQLDHALKSKADEIESLNKSLDFRIAANNKLCERIVALNKKLARRKKNVRRHR